MMDGKVARILVDNYYIIQEHRIAFKNQLRTVGPDAPEILLSILSRLKQDEKDIRKWLDNYTDSQPAGRWAKSICGIGPIIAAGLLADLDISLAPKPDNFYSFCGLAPGIAWEKGQKRPWNGRLKTLCWKLGESFVKFSKNKKDVYGKVYLQRKLYEQAKNEAGEYAEQAAAILEHKKIGKSTVAYKAYSQGRLPDGHIHQRAKRYAVKRFLGDLWEVMREQASVCELDTIYPEPAPASSEA